MGTFDTKRWFADAVQRLQKTAFSVSYALLGNVSDCEEATSQAILNAYEHLGGLRNRAAFGPWFLRILKNECYAVLRRRARFGPLDEETPARDALPARDLDLQRALSALPAEQRVVLVLQYVEGYGVEEIAGILDIPCGTVKSRASRAKAALRAALTEEDRAI